MNTTHPDLTHGDWQNYDRIDEESACRFGDCYAGMAIGLPLSLAIWAGLIALAYKFLF